VADPEAREPGPRSRTGRPIPPLGALLDLLGRRLCLRVLWELRDGPHTFRALRERLRRRVAHGPQRPAGGAAGARAGRGRRRGYARRAGRAAGGAPAAAERVGDGVGETARVAVTERGSADR